MTRANLGVGAMIVILVAAACGGRAGGGDELPQPQDAWIEDFRTGYFKDLSGDPIVDTQGRYTQALIDKLEGCGGGRSELDALKRTVKGFEIGGGPAVGDPPAVVSLHRFGGESPQAFTVELDLVAAGAYELRSCSLSSD